MSFVFFNPNPEKILTDDCVIRALSRFLNQSWERTYFELADKGLSMYQLPNTNSVWGAYLRSKGYSRSVIPNTCPDCYTVIDFCNEHRYGKYLLATGTHVVAVENGNYYDTWDSGDEIPIYYWKEN